MPIQQLFVLNSEFMIQTARAWFAGSKPAVNRAKTRQRASAGPMSGSTAVPPQQREIALGRAFLQIEAESGESRAFAVRRATLDGTAATVGRAVPGDLSRRERYAQALLAANEFVYVD